MSVPVRLAAFVLLAAVTFGAGAALGAAFGPEPSSPTREHVNHVETPKTIPGDPSETSGGEHP
ncbi:MAG: hypothetical protein HYR89_01580 [Actinobacteria bacterium]|nr:hypothetical protein [Actinomycetota bacterium]